MNGTTALAEKWLASKPTTPEQFQMKADALAWLAGMTLAQCNPSGCIPGRSCKCDSYYSMCRMWTTLEREARKAHDIPEPPKPRIINKYGQDVTGRIYPSKAAAIHDVYGSLCE